ncbi:ABC transporter substrate-binding protein [Mahella australiensis]|uniref:Extracellular solute-binding protein family 1 n=1 Tax=Mahella australiensis (strain DSM 15567 / CIP 107919 / 50-1 BON) TaxID=697281 RepID=F4A2E8_MAHA5|nr:ABC transporter substrate-binding protein [Mahella australiensis]AEE97214.1 extracellular solute-binding protein family 1 [Mahella australiensis 50-1 BON]
MKRFGRPLAILLVLLLSLSMVLAGCSNSEQSEQSTPPADQGQDDGEQAAADMPKEKVKLDFWSFWGSATRRPIIEKIVSDFNGSQDGIEVKYTFVPWGDIWTKNLAAIAAGNPPDAIINDINTVAHRANQKQNTNLAPYLSKESENIQERFFPQLWEAVLFNGEAYGLPFNTDTRLLFWNKEHFAEVGLDPESPPQTWAQLEEYAKKLDKVENGKYTRIGFYPLWGVGADIWMLNSDGKNFIDKDGNVYVNTPEKIQALEWIVNWRNRLGEKTVNAFQAEFGSQQADPFISGKVSMMVQNMNFYTQLRDYGKDVKYGVTFVPEREEGSGHWSWGGGFAVEIPYGAKHPEESYQFIKYLTDVDAQSYWAKWGLDMVANKNAANDPELQSIDVYKVAVEAMDKTLITPTPIFAPDFISLLNPQIDAAVLGKASVQDALNKAQSDIENLVKSNKK